MAVKVEELRFGNLVYTPNMVETSVIIDDLVGIEIDGLVFEPIPLTEEWLLRFGFDIETNDDNVKDAYFGTNPINENWLMILTNTSGTWFYENGHFKIRYVHQLQNLYYALTGKELSVVEIESSYKNTISK